MYHSLKLTLKTTRRLFGKFSSDFSRKILHRLYSNKNILGLHDRKLFEDLFPDSCPELHNLFTSPQCFYSGFDPTADSLHIGNLLVIIALLQCQRSGHNVIAVIGDASVSIGDPSGKSTDRKPLAQHEVNCNSESIHKSLQRIFNNHETYFWKEHNEKCPLNPVKILNNKTWYADKNVVEFLSTYGRNMRIGPMLGRKSVKSRIDSEFGMSLCEFSYQLFQAYDWLHLLQNFDCKFQIGGSDQMGNIHAGHDFIDRMTDKNVYGLTVPLVTAESGDKFGKTAGNAVWLNQDKTNSFEFYQFFIRLSDAEAENMFPMFTFYPLSEVNQLIGSHQKNPEKRTLQKKLAEDLTLLIHAEQGLALAKKATSVLYDKNPEALLKLSPDEFKVVFSQSSSIELLLEPGMTVLQVAMLAKCFAKEDDAIRIMKSGGFYMNHIRVYEPEHVLVYGQHILPNYISLLRVGKKNYYIIKWLQ